VTDAPTIDFAGAALTLLPGRAAWWPDESTLLIADAHLGKPASYRAAGAPVPEAVTASDLKRLTDLLTSTGAGRLVVLGDLVHDHAAWRATTLGALARWRESHAEIDILLIRGNHDVRASDPPEDLGVEVADPGLRLGPLELHHDPETVGETPALCGHLHPGVRLRARRHTGALRAPCFWFSPRAGVLPAFGAFTGCMMIRPAAGDRVFAVGESGVLEVPMEPNRRYRAATPGSQ